MVSLLLLADSAASLVRLAAQPAHIGYAIKALQCWPDAWSAVSAAICPTVLEQVHQAVQHSSSILGEGGVLAAPA